MNPTVAGSHEALMATSLVVKIQLVELPSHK
jgi:hypothetical protein